MLIGDRQEMRLVFTREFEPRAEGYKIQARFSAYVMRLDEQNNEGHGHALLVRVSGRVESLEVPRPFPERTEIWNVWPIEDRDDVSAPALLAVDHFRLCESSAGAALVAKYRAEKDAQKELRDAEKNARR